jgi:hypothetical protein
MLDNNEQDTGKYRINLKDKFYTRMDVAKKCIDTIISKYPKTNASIWIEPSAGDGSFLRNVPNGYEKIGIDLEPGAPDIIATDFLKWNYENKNKGILIFGNPPFGRQASLAKAFIKKSCAIADMIAFILPKSFLKPSMSNAFGIKFHCEYSINLERDSFLINGVAHDVPCVFQIWVKKQENRAIVLKEIEMGFKYKKPNELYDLAIRRVGWLAGKAYRRGEKEFNVQTHYFVKLDNVENGAIEKLMEQVNLHKFTDNTVGPRSISKAEMNVVLNGFLQIEELKCSSV